MGAPKDCLRLFFSVHIFAVCAWRETGEAGMCPFPLLFLCHSLPFAVCVLLPPPLPTFSLDNRRDSPGGVGTASSAFPGFQNTESAKRLLDGVLNENGAPHL